MSRVLGVDDQPIEEVMEWILNATDGPYDDQIQTNGQSLVILCCATLLMSLMSAITNYVTLVRLIRTKVKNITLLTMKSCVGADILSTLMFIVFVCPAWFTGKVIYSAITCYVEGFLKAWAELSLYAGLVFLLIQRYVLAHKMLGYKIFRDKHRLCVASVWLVTGVISSLPLVYSLSIYVHSKSLSHCVLDNRNVQLLFDILSLIVPAVFLVLAAVINGQANQHFQKNIQGSSRREGVPNSREGLVSAQGQTGHSMVLAGEVTMGVLAATALDSSMTGIETTLALSAVAYTTAMWAVGIFGLRTYGWTGTGFSIPLATTHLLVFCSSFTRAVILLMVDSLARPYMRERGLLDDTQPSSAYSMYPSHSPACRWTNTDTSTSDIKARSGDKSQENLDDYIPLTFSPVRSVPKYGRLDHMAAFWSNKPCDMTASSQVLDLLAEPSPLGARLLLRDGPLSTGLCKDLRINDDNIEVLLKRSECKVSESRRIHSEKRENWRANQSFSLQGAHGSQKSTSRHQDAEVEPRVLLSSLARHKDSVTGGEFVWLNRLSGQSSESEGVTIYDRFLVGMNARRTNTPSRCLPNSDMNTDGTRRSSTDLENTRRAANGDGSNGQTVAKQRRQVAKHTKNKDQNEESHERKRSHSDIELSLTLTAREERMSRRERGRLRYMKKPPPNRLRLATYIYKSEK